MNGSGMGTTHDMRKIDSFSGEALADEQRIRVLAQNACKSASGTETGSGDKCRGGKSATLPLTPAHLQLGVCRRIGGDIQQIIHRRAAETENIVGADCGHLVLIL
jgi:hypothetical protein